MASLGEHLWKRLSAAPDGLVCTHVALDGGETEVRGRDLLAAAAGVRAAVEALGLAPASLVAIVHRSGPMLHASWLGVLFAGHVPTMVAPPSPRMEAIKYAEGFASIMRELGIDAAVIDAESRAKLGDLLPDMPAIVTDALAPAEPRPPEPRGAGEDAVVQHTSGTTGAQKAIGFTSDQIAAHAGVFAEVLEIGERDVIASWLPLYHDMGFIACFVMPLWLGIPIVEISPFDWVTRPALLFDAIDRHRATLCWLPNFAFKVLSGERLVAAEGAGWRLGHVRAFINCSEPVQAGSVDQFVSRLAPFGVRAEQLLASYAMAENLFLVTQSPIGSPVRGRFDKAGIDAGEEARPDPEGLELVSSGEVTPGTELQVRGPAGVLPEGGIGELWIRGIHLFRGYRKAEAANAEAFDADGWYRTGDIGFVRDRNVYVTGRRKELIIIRGRNYYPQDVEALVGEVESVNPGRIAAFGVPDEASGTEKLIIMLELLPGREDAAQKVQLAVRQRVAQALDTTVGDVRIVPARALVKSTSGKVARGENRRRYLEGSAS